MGSVGCITGMLIARHYLLARSVLKHFALAIDQEPEVAESLLRVSHQIALM